MWVSRICSILKYCFSAEETNSQFQSTKFNDLNDVLGNELIEINSSNKNKRRQQQSFSNKKKKSNHENKIAKTSPFVSNENSTKTKVENNFEYTVNTEVEPQQFTIIATKPESREMYEYEKINSSDYIIDEASLILNLLQEPLIDSTITASTTSDNNESLFLSENFRFQNQDINNSNTSFNELIDGIIELADGIEDGKEMLNNEKTVNNNIDFSEFLNMDDIDKMLNFSSVDYSFNEKTAFNELIF